MFCYKRKHNDFIKNNKVILKTQQRFKNERHNVFTKEIDKIASRSNDDKKNAINWFDGNICIWNEQSSSKWKGRV